MSFKSILTSVMSATLHPTRIDRIPTADRLHMYIKLPGDALFRKYLRYYTTQCVLTQ